MGRNQKAVKISKLKCIKCNSIFPIARKVGSLREKNHIKDLWCYKCKTITKHIENYEELKMEELM